MSRPKKFTHKDPLDCISFTALADNIEYNTHIKGKPDEQGHLFTFEGKQYIAQVKEVK